MDDVSAPTVGDGPAHANLAFEPLCNLPTHHHFKISVSLTEGDFSVVDLTLFLTYPNLSLLEFPFAVVLACEQWRDR